MSPRIGPVFLASSPPPRKLFCAADVDQNGSVSMEEFVDFVLNGKQVVAKISQELCPKQLKPKRHGLESW